MKEVTKEDQRLLKQHYMPKEIKKVKKNKKKKKNKTYCKEKKPFL